MSCLRLLGVLVLWTVSKGGGSSSYKFLLLAYIWLFYTYVASSSENLVLNHLEGDKVFVPCFNKEKIIMWKINGSLYRVNRLPEELFLQSYPNGIYVEHTTFKITGEFICFGKTEKLLPISSVMFVVHKRNPTAMHETSDESGSTFFDEPEKIETESNLQLDVHSSDIAFIPCMSSFKTQGVIWSIDGSLYPQSELPAYHIYKSTGIIVYNISSEFNTGTVYNCYSVINGTLQKLFATTLHHNDPLLEFSSVLFENRQRLIKVVSNGVDLSNRDPNYNFQFRIVNATQPPDYCQPGNVTFTMNVQNSVGFLWSGDTNTYLPKFSPPREKFEENVYAEVYSTNSSGQECAQLFHTLKIDLNDSLIKVESGDCVSEGSDVCCVAKDNRGCFQLPAENLGNVVVIWPRAPHSDEDCACAVFYPTAGLRFEDCYCLNLGLTSYNVTLIDGQLCWNNLTRNTNGTKVFFVEDAAIEPFQRTFKSETQFIFQDDPSPPIISLDSSNSVQIKSTNPEWGHVLSTNIIVRDNTNDYILKDEIPRNDVLLSLEHFPQSCAPLIVYATAHTQCSKSSTARVQVGSSSIGEDSSCECLNIKVDIKINSTMIVSNPSSNSVILTFNTLCLEVFQYNIDNITNLYVHSIETSSTEQCEAVYTPFTIQCDQSLQSVSINDLKEAANYSLSIAWISPFNSTAICKISNSDTYIYIIGPDTATDSSSLIWWAYVLIAIIGTGAMIILCLLMCCCYHCLCKYTDNTNETTYSVFPRNDDSYSM